MTRWTDQTDMIVVKAGTGVGAGLVADGRLLHGSCGAAGDIGHVHVPEAEGRLCRCGQTGCLETVAGGAGIARSLVLRGVEAAGTDDVVSLVRSGNPVAVQALREAGRRVG
ncbi:MAG: ROK family protein, partial [Actinomyces dentalis]